MPTKKCPKCGWELAARAGRTTCPICKTKFEIGVCTTCGELVEYYRGNKCRHCYDTVSRTPRDHYMMNQRREQFWAEWLSWIAKIPKDYPTLTEEQWMAAVKHFNGCAICGAENIDSRGYFVPFEDGGRYCDWNMLPMCDKCATAIRVNKNYFKRKRPKRLMEIIDYLEVKIHAAISRSTAEPE